MMEQKSNSFKRIPGILAHPKETFEKICEAPTSWKAILLILITIMTMFSVFLIQIPTGLNSILIAASVFPAYLIGLLFFGVVVIITLIFFLLINLIYLFGKPLRNSKKEHRSRKVILNIYIYSLVPLLLLISQIPFILIFRGSYSLFNLRFFYYFLMGIVFGWHFTLLYRGIQVNSDISPNRAKLITGIYIGIICFSASFLIYAILYINFDISWLGFLA